MLLGNFLQDRGIEQSLIDAPDEVYTIWRNREHIEVEATIIFDQLARDLTMLWGAKDPITQLALRSSHDEARHALRCQQILSNGENDYPPLKADYKIQFGHENFSPIQRVLYTALGVCCITETLSTALLLEMHQRARTGFIKDTIHEILVDEVDHGKLGWAILSKAAISMDISWLSEHVPGLIKEAFSSDITPMIGVSKDLCPWGILTEKDARPIMNQTIESVIKPGLKQFGIVFL